MLNKYPTIVDRIQQINIEMHFTRTLRVDEPEVLVHMRDTFELFTRHGFIPWFIFPQGGSRKDRIHLKQILDLGFPQNLCCFEIGFLRNPVSALARKDIIPIRRTLNRPESIWKWGQVWGNTGIEYVKHRELSPGGRGLSTFKAMPALRHSEESKRSCFGK